MSANSGIRVGSPPNEVGPTEMVQVCFTAALPSKLVLL
jgi:hypothetical protein